MTAALLTAPVTDEAAFGIIFVSPRGYMNMCGHGSMGVATIAIEMGILEPREPVTEALFDTPAGPIRVIVNVKNGRAKNATLENVPSFFYKTELIKIPNIGDLPIDIAYGGSNCAFLEAKYLGMETHINDILKSETLLTQIKEAINQQVKVQHPEIDYIKGVEGVLIMDRPTNPRANVKIINAGPHGRIDRSPCGTGTSARMATQFSKGELNLGETFVTESITGTLFYSKPIKETIIGTYKAVVPEITGRAFVTGIHNFVIDEDDPFKYGFQL
jgi:proline racemase